MNRNEQIHIKVILLGGYNSGKTALISRYFENAYLDGDSPSIGASLKTETIEDRANRRTFVLNVWDTVGMERFMSINATYVRDTSVVLLIVEANERESLNSAEHYFEMVQNNNSSNPEIILVVTKIDTISGFTKHMEVTEAFCRKMNYYDKLMQFAERKHIEHVFWTSAKEDGLNVDMLFHHITDKLLSSSTQVPVNMGSFAINQIPPESRCFVRRFFDWIWG